MIIFEKIIVDNDEKNRGFAGGNNIGIKKALEMGADYILLLNNDTIVEPDFLKKLVEAGEKDEKAGILGPVIYEYGTNPSASEAGKIHFAGGKINRLYTKGIHIQSTKCQIQTTDYITGCCLLIKREVIEKIGLMDEDYFLYCEDVDWCIKARKAGYKCVVVSAAKIWHKVSSSTKEFSFSYIYYHARNGLLLARRNAPFFIKISAYLNSFFIFFKQIVKLIIFPQKKIWAKAIMTGIKDFYRGKFGKYENWHRLS